MRTHRAVVFLLLLQYTGLSSEDFRQRDMVQGEGIISLKSVEAIAATIEDLLQIVELLRVFR